MHTLLKQKSTVFQGLWRFQLPCSFLILIMCSPYSYFVMAKYILYSERIVSFRIQIMSRVSRALYKQLSY